MPNIKITVAGKIATNTTPGEVIVCGNSDYTVTFDLDAEWAAEPNRTARFVYYKNGLRLFKDAPFTGNTAPVPKLSNIDYVEVGVYAGDLRTTTPARVLCDRSILCGDAMEQITSEEKASLEARVAALERGAGGNGGDDTGGNGGDDTGGGNGDGGPTVITGKNLFDPSKLLRSGDGAVNASTGEIIDGEYWVYGKYSLTVGETYTLSKTGKAALLYFYNADGTYATSEMPVSVGGGNNTRTFTTNCPLIIISGSAEMTEYHLQIEKGDTATEYEPYTETVITPDAPTTDPDATEVRNLRDKKVLIFGDSISTGDTSGPVTTDYGYDDDNRWVEALIEAGYFAEENVTNSSLSSSGFVANKYGNDNLIYRLRKYEGKGGDYDLVIVFAGINDSLRADTLEIGFGMDDQGNKQEDITRYFVPAVDTFFSELVETFVNARICVVLPLRTRHKYAGHGWGTAPAPTLLIGETARLETDYADYIAKVAEEYCLPVLDATRHSGFSPRPGSAFYYKWVKGSADRGLDENGQQWSDGVHPTQEYSYKYLAPYIRGFIDGLI